MSTDYKTGPDFESALAFLTALWPELPAGLLMPVWAKGRAKVTTWCGSPEEAAAAAMQQRGAADVYVGVSLQDQGKALAEAEQRKGNPVPPRAVRGFSETAGAIAGLWADVDVFGPAHKSQKLPPDEAAAVELIGRLVLEPTILVRSGGGLQAWWLFREPWVFSGDADRAEAARLAAAWVMTLQSHAAVSGWEVDSTIDLARVLRVPGTFNRKPELGEPRPVTAEVRDVRYDPDDFRPHLSVMPLAGAPRAAGPTGAPAAPQDLAERLARTTLTYLVAGAREGNRNNALFKAACDFAGNGVGRAESERQLGARAEADGLTPDEIKSSFDSAYGRPRSPSKPAEDDGAFGSALDRERGTSGPPLGDTGRTAAEMADDFPPKSYADVATAPSSSLPPDLQLPRGKVENVIDVIQTDPRTNDEKAIRYYCTMPQIAAAVAEVTGGWPRRAGGILFGVRQSPQEIPDMKSVIWIANAKELFAWMGHGCDIRWAVGDAQHHREKHKLNPPTKDEVYCYMKQNAMPAYRAVEVLPHVPPLPDLYYLPCQLPAEVPGGPSPLAELVSRFNPETEADRRLMLAALVTPGWGGPTGARPAFIFTSDHGRGVGKTATATALAEVWGGAMTIGAKEDWEQVKKRLFSDDALAKRVLLIDNIKGRMSGQDIEGMITARDLEGWKPYHGGASRPNLMTWYFTANTPSLSRDLADRSVIIKIGRQQHTQDFVRWVGDFIRANRAMILAELMGILSRPPACDIEDANRDRWGAWQDAVLSRFANGSQLARLILDRRPTVDSDAEDADEIAGSVVKLVAEHFPDDYADRNVFITRQQLYNRLLRDGVVDRNFSPRAVTTWVRERCGSGPLWFLTEKRLPDSRGWLFVGERSPKLKGEPDRIPEEAAHAYGWNQ